MKEILYIQGRKSSNWITLGVVNCLLLNEALASMFALLTFEEVRIVSNIDGVLYQI
ncbi:MAG: hypothetical protein AABY07_00805 [Nanoarchaeota archaeon]